MQDNAQPNVIEKEVETPATLSDDTTTGLPLDIVLSLLKPDELEKLQKYITSYLAKHGQQ
jgi:hypothetical protein